MSTFTLTPSTTAQPTTADPRAGRVTWKRGLATGVTATPRSVPSS